LEYRNSESTNVPAQKTGEMVWKTTETNRRMMRESRSVYWRYLGAAEGFCRNALLAIARGAWPFCKHEQKRVKEEDRCREKDQLHESSRHVLEYLLLATEGRPATSLITP
jgi:hypothetical protein